MNFHNFILGGVRVGLDSSIKLSQSIFPLDDRGGKIRRYLGGGGFKQTHFDKLGTVITGQGRRPAGLGDLDYTGELVLHCAAPLDVAGVSNELIIPRTYRTDAPVLGYAEVDGREVPTGISLDGQAATLVSVPNATGYKCLYFPIITVLAYRPRYDFIGRPGVSWRFTLEAEEK